MDKQEEIARPESDENTPLPSSSERESYIWAFLHWILQIGSGEFMLSKRPNSGSVIFLRAAWVSIFAYAAALVLKECFSPGVKWGTFELEKLWKAISETVPWLGATFAASYAALYTRFASQWAYLAELYNQIMSTQAQVQLTNDESKRVLAIWKAAFIEDAEEVHLAEKPVIAGVIISWLKDEEVRKAYSTFTPGFGNRLQRLEKRVQIAFDLEAFKQLK